MIFALADLHLSFTQRVTADNIDFVRESKPMDIFGPEWERHHRQILTNWCSLVNENDTVLLAGDLSWAVTLSEAVYDLDFIGQLPGKKIIIRGNHDYWWSSISKIRAALPQSIVALQNDCALAEGKAVCGTRGWLVPNTAQKNEHDERIWQREICRLELSLKQRPANYEETIVMLHYMPANQQHEFNAMIELMADYGVTRCIYGHLHGQSHCFRLPAEKWGIRFSLVSADYLKFRPLALPDNG